MTSDRRFERGRAAILSHPQPITFAHLSRVRRLIPQGPSHLRGKRRGNGPNERDEPGLRGRELAGRVRVVRMLPRFRRIRRRRLRISPSIPPRSAGPGSPRWPRRSRPIFPRPSRSLPNRDPKRCLVLSSAPAWPQAQVELAWLWMQCAGRESNPRRKLGRLGSYRWTTRARSFVNPVLRLSLPLPSTGSAVSRGSSTMCGRARGRSGAGQEALSLGDMRKRRAHGTGQGLRRGRGTMLRLSRSCGARSSSGPCSRLRRVR